MGVVVELTSRSNSSRRCVRDLSHQANHGYFGQLEAQATRSGLFFVCSLNTFDITALLEIAALH
jgi:DNA-binding protein Fis